MGVWWDECRMCFICGILYANERLFIVLAVDEVFNVACGVFVDVVVVVVLFTNELHA